MNLNYKLNIYPNEILDLIRENKPVVEEMQKFREFEKGEGNEHYREVIGREKADNKMFINFPREIKETHIGLNFSEPFKLTHKDNPTLQEFVDEMFAYNNKDVLGVNLGEEMIVSGKAFWSPYINKYKYLMINAPKGEEIILVRDGSYLNEIELAIRYFWRTDMWNKDKKEILNVEVYTDAEIYFFIENDKGELIMDYSRKQNPAKHIFKHVPFVEFTNNNNESEFKQVYDIVNAYSRLINAGTNELEDLQHAYLVLLNANMTDEELEKAIRQRAIILNSDKDVPTDVKFLIKNTNTDSFEQMIDRLRTAIYDTAGIPDFKNIKNNTNDMSGRAMQQMWQRGINKAKVRATSLTRGMQDFLVLIEPYVYLKTGIKYEITDWNIQFPITTQIPLDFTGVEEIIKMQQAGTMSHESLLALLPFVKNPQQEMEKLKKQQEEEMGIDYPNLHLEE